MNASAAARPGASPMSRFIAGSLVFYVGSILVGLLLRWSFVRPVEGLSFSNALHAHSHTLYFGWAGLAVCALWFLRLGATRTVHRVALATLVGIAAVGFFTFLEGGYSRASMVVSTLALGSWGWLGALLLRALKGRSDVPAHLLRVAVVYLVLAVLGAVLRVIVLAMKVEDPVWGLLAVFAFVHNFAWFVLFAAIGLLREMAAELRLRFDDRALTFQIAGMAATAWLTFPLGVVGAQDGYLGLLARLAATGLAMFTAGFAFHLWRASSSAAPRERRWIRLIALWSFAQALGELAGASGLSAWATTLRHPAVIYLHVMLVGVATSLLLLLVARTVRAALPRSSLHHGGLALMCAGLGCATAPLVMPALSMGLSTAGLWLAFAGALAMVLGAAEFGWQIAAGTRSAADRISEEGWAAGLVVDGARSRDH